MKLLRAPAVLSALTMIFVAMTSCTEAPTTPPSTLGAAKTPIQEAVVQVWNPATTDGSRTLLALGVVVGDGTQVLTVLNYEHYNPGDLEVVVPGRSPLKAAVQMIDPRTSATLLKLQGTTLPAAGIGDSATIQPGQQAYVWGWPDPKSNLEGMPVVIAGYQVPFLPFSFNVYLSNDTLTKDDWGWVGGDNGAPVTDDKGNVLGLVGTDYTLVPILGPIGRIPPVVGINNAIGLLSPGAAGQPWARGPALTYIGTKDTVTGHSPPVPSTSGYNRMTVALSQLFGQMGKPLGQDELPQDYRKLAWPDPWSADGTVLTVLYPQPVELQNADGEIVARAKWVGIQWGRSDGEPNRLFYGTTAYVVQGGFFLDADMTGLQSAIR